MRPLGRFGESARLVDAYEERPCSSVMFGSVDESSSFHCVEYFNDLFDGDVGAVVGVYGAPNAPWFTFENSIGHCERKDVCVLCAVLLG